MTEIPKSFPSEPSIKLAYSLRLDDWVAIAGWYYTNAQRLLASLPYIPLSLAAMVALLSASHSL